MPTTHQHLVPKAYLKAWQTHVRNSQEPNKRFDGVYIIDDSAIKGEGVNIKNVLWSQGIYTIKFRDYSYICILRRPAAADAELNGRDAVCQRPAGLRY